LPIGVIVTTIQRRRNLVVPDGSTVLEVGDEPLLIGQSSGIDVIRRAAAGRDSDPDGHRRRDDHGEEPKVRSMLARGFRDTGNQAGRARDDRRQPSIR
jgi:hypothetical protein